MRETINKTWDIFELQCKKIAEQEKRVIFNNSSDKKQLYYLFFEKKYKFIKENYMNEDTKYLDRHKVTAIIIISLLETNCIEYTEGSNDKIFYAKYAIPLNVGLSYMFANINYYLGKDQKKLSTYHFPEPMACKTETFDIMARNLYYIDQNQNWTFNELDLAEKLFWLESYSLLAENIDPAPLKEQNLSKKILSL